MFTKVAFMLFHTVSYSRGSSILVFVVRMQYGINETVRGFGQLINMAVQIVIQTCEKVDLC